MGLSWLGIMALFMFSSSFAVSLSSGVTDKPSKSRVLRPVKIEEFESMTGLNRRMSNDFSDLDLQTQDRLIYGSPDDSGHTVMADMTLFAPDGLQMIMMERFEGYTSTVDCNDDDGILSLTFKSQEAYEYALNTWSHINQRAEDRFILIANHDGCGQENGRTPYYITQVIEEREQLKTSLIAQSAPWSEIAGTYNLNFGHFSAPKVAGRGIIDDIKGDFDASKGVTVPINLGTPHQLTNLLHAGPLTLDCVNCYVSGAFKVTGRIVTHHWKIQDLSITANPSDFHAVLDLKATVLDPSGGDPLKYQKALFGPAPLGDLGFTITGILDVGAIVEFVVGANAIFEGNVGIEFGLKAQLPDSASLVGDISHPDHSSATGFNGALTPIFNVTDLTKSVAVSAYAAPKVTFGFELHHIGKADIGLELRLPQVTVTLDAEEDPKGLCSQEPGASKTGVKLDSSASISLNLILEASSGIVEAVTGPNVVKRLVGITQPLFKHCFPIKIAGLLPSTTSAPVVASTAATGGLKSDNRKRGKFPVATDIGVSGRHPLGTATAASGRYPFATGTGGRYPFANATAGYPLPTGSGFGTGTGALGTRRYPRPTGAAAPSGTVLSGTAPPAGTGAADYHRPRVRALQPDPKSPALRRDWNQRSQQQHRSRQPPKKNGKMH